MVDSEKRVFCVVLFVVVVVVVVCVCVCARARAHARTHTHAFLHFRIIVSTYTMFCMSSVKMELMEHTVSGMICSVDCVFVVSSV